MSGIVTRGWQSALVIGGSTVLSWLLGAPGSWPGQSHPPAGSVSSPVGENPRMPELPAALHAWQGRTFAPARSERNLFGFRQPVAPAPTRRQVAAFVPAPVTPAPAATMPFRLIGIARDVADDASSTTAILTGDEQVHLVKEGDTVGTFTVTSVLSDSVELTDRAGGAPFRLAMK